MRELVQDPRKQATESGEKKEQRIQEEVKRHGKTRRGETRRGENIKGSKKREIGK